MKILSRIILPSFILSTTFLGGCANQTENLPSANATTANTQQAPANSIKRTELIENAAYAMEINTLSPAIDSSADTVFTFSVKDKDGKPFKNLKIVHEQPVHLLIVSHDLAFFDHVHPEVQEDGKFRLKYKFPAGGKYKIYTDFTPENSAQTIDVFDVAVSGQERAKTPLVPDAEFVKTVDGLAFTMETSGKFKAANPLELRFFVKDAEGKAVTDLEPYLGAMAHFVVISEDGAKFLHVHAMDGKTAQASGSTGNHENHQRAPGAMEMEMKPDAKNPQTPTVRAHTEFPTGGKYKLWGQFKRQGKVYTVPFIFEVEAADGQAKNVEIPADALKITVSKNGFEPSEIKLDPAKYKKLAFLRTDSENCGSEVVFSKLDIKKSLPVGEVVLIDLPPNLKNETLNFACGMNMLKGSITIQ